MAYIITKIQNPTELYVAFKVVENFIDYTVYEDAAPVSTLETSIQIILLEYSEMVLKSQNHNSAINNLAFDPNFKGSEIGAGLS